MRAARRIEGLDLRGRQADRAIEHLAKRGCPSGHKQQQCPCALHGLAYPSMNRPIAKIATPRSIISSMVLTVKPAPVAARELVVICSIIDTGNSTNPITCNSLPSVRIGFILLLPRRRDQSPIGSVRLLR